MKAPTTKRQAYAQFMLRLLGAGTLILLAGSSRSVSPLRMVKTFSHFSSHELARLHRALKTLERRRLIKLVQQGDQIEVRLTPNGQQRAKRIRAEELQLERPVRWDGKWRLIIFDIPEYLRVGRDTLRATLNRLGFYQMQKSVFIYPFSCEKEIEALVSALGLASFVHCHYIVLRDNWYERKLKRHFQV